MKRLVGADVVSDILDRLHRAGVSEHALRQVEREIRSTWGGTRSYIAKEGDDQRSALLSRDDCIRRDASRGVSRQYLVRRYQLSYRRISQILAERN